MTVEQPVKLSRLNPGLGNTHNSKQVSLEYGQWDEKWNFSVHSKRKIVAECEQSVVSGPVELLVERFPLLYQEWSKMDNNSPNGNVIYFL